MEYIAITLLAISATTCVIYLLANKVFGVCLRLRSLVMCAACALFISLVLPRIVVSFAGLAGTVGFLAVFAIIFAYFVAYYDDPELQNAANACPAVALGGEPLGQDPVNARETVVALAETQASSSVLRTPDSVPASTGEESHSEDSDKPSSSSLNETGPDILEPATATDPLLVFAHDTFIEDDSVEEMPQPDEESVPSEQKAVDVSQTQLAAATENEVGSDLSVITDLSLKADECNSDTETDFVIEDIDNPELASVILALESPEDYEPVEEELLLMETPVEDDHPEHVNGKEASSTCDVSIDNSDEMIDPRTLFGNADFIAVNSGDETEQIPPSDNLDALLDYAFSQKERCNYQRSLDAFRRALKLYRESEAAPYLAIEIATLLKDRGSYDEAINVLSDSRGLPGLNQQHPLDQEFIETIAYLRIVKNTLLHHRLGFIPFHRIPTAIAKEIDAEFRDWRNLA